MPRNTEKILNAGISFFAKCRPVLLYCLYHAESYCIIPWRGYALALLAAFVLGSLPTFAALWAEDEQHRFNGLSFFRGHGQLRGVLRSGGQGAWLFHNRRCWKTIRRLFQPLMGCGRKLMALFGLSFSGLFWLLRFLGLWCWPSASSPCSPPC
jgi:hypothetical protein